MAANPLLGCLTSTLGPEQPDSGQGMPVCLMQVAHHVGRTVPAMWGGHKVRLSGHKRRTACWAASTHALDAGRSSLNTAGLSSLSFLGHIGLSTCCRLPTTLGCLAPAALNMLQTACRCLDPPGPLHKLSQGRACHSIFVADSVQHNAWPTRLFPCLQILGCSQQNAQPCL